MDLEGKGKTVGYQAVDGAKVFGTVIRRVK
jgi:hypothetical protein